jgi:hypothetical protein
MVQLQLFPGSIPTTPQPVAAAIYRDRSSCGIATEQAEGVTVVLVRDVDDAIASFHGSAGERFDAYVDHGGDVWIPWGLGKEQDVALEPEDFEIATLD